MSAPEEIRIHEIWPNLAIGVSRMTNEESLAPHEAIDRVEASMKLTVWAAEWIVAEDISSWLEPGKWADYIFLE